MTTYEIPGVAVTFGLWLAAGIPLGAYLAAALRSPEERGEPHWSDRAFGWIERPLYRLAGVDPDASTGWRSYVTSLLASNLIVALAAYFSLLAMGRLPLNPDGIAGMEPTLAFHSAAAFITNTDQQHYSGETGASHLAQLGSFMFLMFLSAGTGLAVFTAICRALSNRNSALVGNFHADLTRAVVRVLIPLCVPLALALAWQGAPMTFEGRAAFSGLGGPGGQTGDISRGPVAAFMAIKHLGTNGGGFFGANAAHPFESPTYLSNMMLVIAQVLLPLGCVFAFGRITGRPRVARALFAAMLAMFLVGAVGAMWSEAAGGARAGFAGGLGNMEGKEVRFGALASAYFAHTTTATSCGAVNAMHDSLTPLAGLVAMVNMWVNCVFGGDGVGFVNMLLYVVVTVFIAGLMVGRTPEFLGKKIETREVKLAGLAILVHPALILGFSAVACAVQSFSAAASNPGAHGFGQILYEYTSAAANNGSGFEGLGDNTPWWNISCGMVMLVGRYIPIIAPLALAASVGAKNTVPEGAGTFRTDNALFVALLVSVVVVVGALLFLPVAVLGPAAEFLGQAKGF